MNYRLPSGRFLIFVGDVILLYVGLFAALAIRYSGHVSHDVILSHILPFSILFIIWILVFIIAGFYKKYVRVLKNRLPSTILKIQIINSLLAVAFFYAVPEFGIAPKTTLFIYLVISFVLITLWRMYGPLLSGNRNDKAIFVISGAEAKELVDELQSHSGYPLTVSAVIDLDTVSDPALAIKDVLAQNPAVNIIVSDLNDPRLKDSLAYFYELIQKRFIYLEIHTVYEDVFERLPVSLLDERWLIENISFFPSAAYDILKRMIDIVVGFVVFLLSLPFYLIVYVLIKLDDGGPIFFRQIRVGQNGKLVSLVKFRSMSVHHEKDGIAKKPEITKIGAFIRKTRIDELPQLWNVVKGDLSLIGPRSEIPKLVELYEKEIPYYSLRHVVKPGLSGWAQITQKNPPKFAAETDLTKQKVSYDLYYIKHRSLALDVLIALRTIQELLLRRGI